MTNPIDHIIEHLFDKKNFDDVSKSELEQLVATHPYFAAGHYLLAKKTQITHPERSMERIATTALYYNNALWLQWLLDQGNHSDEQKQDQVEILINNHDDEDSAVAAISTSLASETYSEESIGQSEENQTAIQSPVPTTDQESNQANQIFETDADSHTLGDVEKMVDSYLPASIETHSNYEPVNESEEENEIDSLKQQEPDGDPPELITDDDNPPKSEITVEQSPSDKDYSTPGDYNTFENDSREEDHTKPTLINQEQSSPSQEIDTVEDAESRASAASIQRTLSTAALVPTKADIEKNEFTFEPYHTIDYFASQGIKLQQSDLSKDKFGKQLKSFTEWLRSMKRLPQTTIESNMDEATQQSIQQIAEHSFEEKEIVTETMAEVWIKQGNKEKAMDTLYKLSLLNPSKSHYFAAKIEQLKDL